MLNPQAILDKPPQTSYARFQNYYHCVMTYYHTIFFLIIISACSTNIKTETKELESIYKKVPELHAILDSSNVTGTIVVYDLDQNTFYSNNFEWAERGVLPASTYKIVNSMIALETGVVEHDSTLLKWDGAKRRIPIWERDLMLRDAFHTSCVPCYQEIARKIGTERTKEYLRKLDYGKIDVDTSNIDQFWLEGNSRITPFEQLDFLSRFYTSKLPISSRTERIMRRLMVIEDKVNYRLSGKTGWSNTNEIDNGWFVGYLERSGQAYFFATNIEPGKEFSMSMFADTRKAVTYEALGKLDLL